ncbi:MAG: hypothetical protein M1826_000703 [Phylliscum demangeonii]|nr:MAG: hypothetical protein M1826_000703 [Phylliscum demangeonii]
MLSSGVAAIVLLTLLLLLLAVVAAAASFASANPAVRGRLCALLHDHAHHRRCPSARASARSRAATACAIASAMDSTHDSDLSVAGDPNRPYACAKADCQKSFNRKSDLQRHERIHTNERPYACEHPNCGKSFIQRSALTVHIRTHTGEKPHRACACACTSSSPPATTVLMMGAARSRPAWPAIAVSTPGTGPTDARSTVAIGGERRPGHPGPRPAPPRPAPARAWPSSPRLTEPAPSFCRKTTLTKHQCRFHHMEPPHDDSDENDSDSDPDDGPRDASPPPLPPLPPPPPPARYPPAAVDGLMTMSHHLPLSLRRRPMPGSYDPGHAMAAADAPPIPAYAPAGYGYQSVYHVPPREPMDDRLPTRTPTPSPYPPTPDATRPPRLPRLQDARRDAERAYHRPTSDPYVLPSIDRLNVPSMLLPGPVAAVPGAMPHPGPPEAVPGPLAHAYYPLPPPDPTGLGHRPDPAAHAVSDMSLPYPGMPASAHPDDGGAVVVALPDPEAIAGPRPPPGTAPDPPPAPVWMHPVPYQPVMVFPPSPGHLAQYYAGYQIGLATHDLYYKVEESDPAYVLPSHHATMQ